MRLLEAAAGGPWLLQAPAAAEEWRCVRQDRRLREADFLLRSRADRRGECSIMTIPGEPAGRIPRPPPFEAAHRRSFHHGRAVWRAEFRFHAPMAGMPCVFP